MHQKEIAMRIMYLREKDKYCLEHFYCEETYNICKDCFRDRRVKERLYDLRNLYADLYPE